MADPDYARTEMERLLKVNHGISQVSLIGDGMVESIDGNDPELIEAIESPQLYDEMDDNNILEIDNWGKLLLDHPPRIYDDRDFQCLKNEQAEMLNESITLTNGVPSPSLATLNVGQRNYYEVMKYLLSTNDCSLAQGVVLKGRGGSGKSYAINTVKSLLLEDNECVTTATTGKAASLLGGSTVYNSSRGLALPVGKHKLKELKGQVLKRLQDVYRSVKVLFVDEYSMLPQKALYYIDQRLKQIKGNTKVFGGIIVVFIGDIA